MNTNEMQLILVIAKRILTHRIFAIIILTVSGYHSIAQVQWNSTVNTGLYSSAIGYQTQSTNNYSFAAGQLSQANGISSMALGNNSTAFGNYSVAIGQSSYAVLQSYAFGQNAKANGQQSLAIGRFVETTFSGINSIILGSSVSGQVMQNGIPYSLMIGFNSTVPTLFVGPSASYTGIGKVGIGTTAPNGRSSYKIHGQYQCFTVCATRYMEF